MTGKQSGRNKSFHPSKILIFQDDKLSLLNLSILRLKFGIANDKNKINSIFKKSILVNLMTLCKLNCVNNLVFQNILIRTYIPIDFYRC